jgi:lipopolysaccharide/colanic/teichoic acid biosynthesis glycosyltransferase
MKRLFDLIAASISLLFLMILVAIIAILVRIKLGSPIFFKQARPGLNGNLFNMYKFRSVTSECDKNGVLLSDKEGLTKFGKFLRSINLDELPGLWNVVQELQSSESLTVNLSKRKNYYWLYRCFRHG